MAKKEDEKREKKHEKVVAEGHRYTLKTVIAKDQRKYIEGVREWLSNSLQNKGKVVGGPI
jgi:hypothetical protein